MSLLNRNNALPKQEQKGWLRRKRRQARQQLWSKQVLRLHLGLDPLELKLGKQSALNLPSLMPSLGNGHQVWICLWGWILICFHRFNGIRDQNFINEVNSVSWLGINLDYKLKLPLPFELIHSPLLSSWLTRTTSIPFVLTGQSFIKVGTEATEITKAESTRSTASTFASASILANQLSKQIKKALI